MRKIPTHDTSITQGHKTELDHLRAQRQILLKDLMRIQDDIATNKRQTHDLENKLRKTSSETLVLTDHATLRYLERIHGISIEDIARRIVTDKLVEMVATLGDGTYPVDDFRVRVINNVIVTVFK